MQNTPQRDTPAELAIRRELHRRGLRYRVQQPIKGVSRIRPDIVFPGPRVIVLVDGCFWHQCPDHGTMPKKNRAWWKEKLEANVARDRGTNERLEEAGWDVIRVWEHEDAVSAADRIEARIREAEKP